MDGVSRGWDPTDWMGWDPTDWMGWDPTDWMGYRLGSHRYKELGSLREVVIDGHGGRFALYGERRRGGVDVAEGLHGDARVRSVRNLKTAAMQLGLVDGEGK